MVELSPKIREIVEQISRQRTGLLNSVQGLDGAQSGYRPSTGSWCIDDVLHHLALTEEASGKLLARMLKRAREEGLAPDPDPERSVLGAIEDLVAGADDEKAPAPDRVIPRSHLPAAEALARLAASRRKLLETLESLSAFDLSRLRYPHPFFGELDTYQWVLITGWHERRHTRQIERIKSSSGFPMQRF